MSISFVLATLAVRTATNDASYSASFEPGLNVIQAPNSWGKSTLVQSLVYGLGLEGAISASHLSPLGEAMTSVIDLDGDRQAVIESSVTLVVRNDAGEFLRTRRYSRSLQYESHLVQTWVAESFDALDGAPQRDYFVRRQGGATNEAGFHLMLEAFMGWDLPSVPGFNGDEIKLYLEVIVPLFYVEQKYGWAGLAPRVPTHYRIRSAYRRAAEFVLGLTSLERLKRVDQTRAALAQAQDAWQLASAELQSSVASHGWRISEDLSTLLQPVGSGHDPAWSLEAYVGDEWIPLSDSLSDLRSSLAALEAVPIEDAGPRTTTAREELAGSERTLALLAAHLRSAREVASVQASETTGLRDRLLELEVERGRLRDVQTLERLGSDLSLSSMSAANCPVCAQSLDAAHVVTGIVLDVPGHLALIDSEKATLNSLIVDADRRLASAEARVEALVGQVTEGRARVRSLKDELAGPSQSPSVSQVEQRLALRSQLEIADAGAASVQAQLEQLAERANAVVRLRQNLSALLRQDADESDRRAISALRQGFRRALESFGLRSLPVEEVTIGEETLLPEHDGFELTFDIRHGMSASDSIRTKWAYYVALAEVASELVSARPIGFLLMDEPRQQEAEFGSVRALYTSLAAVGRTTQVIVASSAAPDELDRLLDGLSVHRISSSRSHMFSNAV